MNTRILRLNKAGVPLQWLDREDAATLLVKGLVVWSLGDTTVTIRGGINCHGLRSILNIPTIIATNGDVHYNDHHVPAVCNRLLFRRDRNTCMYCGDQFNQERLTRDHIIPRSRGGSESWTNLVAACRRCNQRKSDKTPEEACMPLLAIPFKPNKMEYLALANRNILSDQMSFLRSGFSKHMRIN
ncbi:restriction endonuclease [Ketobacter alkanivorans]|uniref:Restriction endonuclease n=2 Tax=Ketobacter alkanivorans TaxID=1917421 RepID=A0A2K9LRU3_9GAMM|nr:restriction endonuclease [Ketobacter alkanivorans]MCP5018846.1 HNH endonuclease [Ketobacter sp.]